MRYVKTDDGIVELKRVATLGDDYYQIGSNYVKKEDLDDCEVADSIEGLCDAVIRVSIDNGKEHYTIYQGQLYSLEDKDKAHEVNAIIKGLSYLNQVSREKTKAIYGAIIIKGEHDEPVFKAVAKLNDKGDLELL